MTIVLSLGRGVSSHVASEGALKLMEVAYIPCIAYPSGELATGPIALISEEGTPVIVIAHDHLKEKTLSNLQECKARGARICLIHTEGDEIASTEMFRFHLQHRWIYVAHFLVGTSLQPFLLIKRIGSDRNI